MIMRCRNKHMVIMILLATAGWELQGQDFSYRGMMAGWGTASYSGALNAQGGVRYVPGLDALYNINEDYKLDAEISANAFGSATFWSDDSIVLDDRLKPYRMWLRFSGDRFELRAGLQKINFGSAAMLRPLMWFDQIDPRDPLQLTDGVYGLLGRYYFLNNANIWVWGLYGNDERKGWEVAPSDRKTIEYGGRAQYPVYDRGEIALSYHRRKADFAKIHTGNSIADKELVKENRVGVDGKFDLGAGIWFEGTLTHQKPDGNIYRQSLNLGMDYTFGLGNGLNLMSEHLLFNTSGRVFGSGESVSFTAVSLNYPFNIFLSLSAIIFYDWTNDDIYNFANCSLQFDKWSFYVMGFWNPDRFGIYRNLEGANLFAGKGIQLMFVYNH